jgi:hypothetical protein
MTRTVIFTSIALTLLLSGCEREVPSDTVTHTAAEATAETALVSQDAARPDDQAISPPGTSILLHDPVELKRYEVPSQALQQWYPLRALRPALLLYTKDPLLQSTTPEVQKSLMARLKDQDYSTLRSDISNPAIVPKMTLHAALSAGLFSQVYWVMPTNAAISELSVEVFRTQMLQAGALSDEEARTLTLRDGVFSGMVRGFPFHALHPQAEFTINGPVAFHFDLSFLSPLYKGEIKTPLYPLVYQTLKHLRNQQLKAISTSFSYAQLSGEVPLGSRFLGDVFEALFKEPHRLDERLPEAWQERAKALYLPELFSNEDARNILLQQAEVHPEDPSLHYALYQVSRQLSSARRAALDHLADAVRLDPVYALEYLVLAPVAREKGRPEEALRVLGLAYEAYPGHPFIALELSRALLDANHGSSAEPILQSLLDLHWSTTFYPDMPRFLKQLLTEAESQKAKN